MDDTADILILPAAIVIDSRRGLDLQLDDDELVQMPPLRVMKDDTALLGLLVRNLRAQSQRIAQPE